MNSLNNVPRFGGPGAGQGFPGSGAGFPGSQQGFPGAGFPGSQQSGFPGSGPSIDSSTGVRRVIPPFLQGADKETEDRVTMRRREEEVAWRFSLNILFESIISLLNYSTSISLRFHLLLEF